MKVATLVPKNIQKLSERNILKVYFSFGIHHDEIDQLIKNIWFIF